MFYQLPEHPFAQSRWHKKLTITAVTSFMKKLKGRQRWRVAACGGWTPQTEWETASLGHIWTMMGKAGKSFPCKVMENILTTTYLHFQVDMYVHKLVTHCSASLYLFLTCRLDSQVFGNIRFSSHNWWLLLGSFFKVHTPKGDSPIGPAPAFSHVRRTWENSHEHERERESSLLLVTCTTFSLLSKGRCGEDLMFRMGCAFSRVV